MKALRKQTFRTLFFTPEKPTEKELTVGRRRFIEEGAVAAVIYSIATGNFLVGYLSYLGASVSFCALVAMIPNFGCVLQFFSPFLFERMHNRIFARYRRPARRPGSPRRRRAEDRVAQLYAEKRERRRRLPVSRAE